MKYYLILHIDGKEPFVIESYNTLKEATRKLNEKIRTYKRLKLEVKESDKNKYEIYNAKSLTTDSIYIDTKPPQQLTIKFNNQNPTTMATSRTPKKDIMKYYLILHIDGKEPFVIESYNTLKVATRKLNEKISTYKRSKLEVKESDKNKYEIYNAKSLTKGSIYIDTKPPQQLTVKFNNQNPTTMATSRTPKKDNWGRVQGNPYQTKVNGKPYMKVPEKMVTLPAGNHFIIARKHQTLSTTYTDKNGNTCHNMAVYVLGYSNLNGKTQSGKTRRHWFVARQFNVGGTPKLSIYRYSGYDRALARRVFMEIACDESFWLKREQHQGGKWEERWVEGNAITAQEVVAAKVKRREYYRNLRGNQGDAWSSPVIR